MASETMEKCQSCKKFDSSDDHTCPFASEIHDDDETLCNCCEECTFECSMDI